MNPDEVLVLANRLGVVGLRVADGTLLWEHSSAGGWPVTGVPLVARMPDGVVAIASHDRVAWLRMIDGKRPSPRGRFERTRTRRSHSEAP